MLLSRMVMRGAGAGSYSIGLSFVEMANDVGSITASAKNYPTVRDWEGTHVGDVVGQNAFGTTTTASINMPVHQSGDLLISVIGVATGSGGVSNSTLVSGSPSSGWTSVSPTNSVNSNAFLVYRTATTTSHTLTMTFGSAVNWAATAISVKNGAVVDSGFQSSENATSVSFPALGGGSIGSNEQRLYLALAGLPHDVLGDYTQSPPTGYTQIFGDESSAYAQATIFQKVSSSATDTPGSIPLEINSGTRIVGGYGLAIDLA